MEIEKRQYRPLIWFACAAGLASIAYCLVASYALQSVLHDYTNNKAAYAMKYTTFMLPHNACSSTYARLMSSLKSRTMKLFMIGAQCCFYAYALAKFEKALNAYPSWTIPLVFMLTGNVILMLPAIYNFAFNTGVETVLVFACLSLAIYFLLRKRCDLILVGIIIAHVLLMVADLCQFYFWRISKQDFKRNIGVFGNVCAELSNYAELSAPIRERALAMLCSEGIDKNNIYVVYSNHANAAVLYNHRNSYFIYTSKFLRLCSEDEILAVTYHELGHYVNKMNSKKVWFFTIWSAAAFGIGGAIAYVLTRSLSKHHAYFAWSIIPLGLRGLVTFPLSYYYGMEDEYRADAHAETMGYGSSAASAIYKLCRKDEGLFFYYPDKLCMLLSHPSTYNRIHRLASNPLATVKAANEKEDSIVDKPFYWTSPSL